MSRTDRTLFLTTLALVVFGLVMVFSASAAISSERFGHPYVFLLRQLAWACLGVLALLKIMHLDYRVYKHARIVYAALSVTLLLLVVVLFMGPSHGTYRWFRLGPLSFQPSEMAKPVLVVFLAWFLESRVKNGVVNSRRTLLSVLVAVCFVAGLVLAGKDLGTSLMLVLIALTMLVVAGLDLRYLLFPALAAIPGFYLAVYRVPYRWDRMKVWIDPFRDASGKGFNMVQSLLAVGAGGPIGAGLMEGKQKLFFLPAPETDFIYAVIAEELGMIGAALLAVAFGIFLWRGLIAAWRAPDTFGRLLAVGFTVMIVFQAFINMSVVLGLLPAKGIPLPFISYGGSSLLFNLVATGVLLNVTQQGIRSEV